MSRPATIRRFFLLHMRPNRVPASTLRYRHTWGLGGMSSLLVVLLIVTGALQMLSYEPTPQRAYQSIVELQADTLFGGLVRSLHHWGANLLIAVVLLHLLRVFFAGAVDGPRRLNWLIGLGLLFCVLAANFTGYLLPWNQLSYWAVTICTGMLAYVPLIGGWLQTGLRGGEEVGAATLIIFYTIHTTLVPVVLAVLMGFHFWRVRKARGVVLPRAVGQAAPAEIEYGRGWPDLILREAVAGAVLLAVVLALAVLRAPALGDPANPGMSPNPAKAPWYFVGFQELQIHFHPVFAVLVIPLCAVAALVWWPYRRRTTETAGIWFGSALGRRLALLAAAIAVVATPLLIVAGEWWFRPTVWWPTLGPLVGNGLIPFLVIAGMLAGLNLIFRRRLRATSEDSLQALFVLLAVAFAVLTATGIWLRGVGMSLAWTWTP